MLYRFTDTNGTFTVKDPQRFGMYFPLTNADGSLLSAIAPNLAGDIKRDNDHFLTLPASSEDLRSSPLCRREFFLKVRGKVYRLSQSFKDTLTCGLLYQTLHKRLPGGLTVEITNFIPHTAAVELMRVRVTNRSSWAVPLTATSFIPLYGRSEKNLRDHRHVSALLNRVALHSNGVVLKPTMIFDEKGHSLNPTSYFVLGCEGDGAAFTGHFPTLDAFCGSGDVFRPEAVYGDLQPALRHDPVFDGKEACAGFRFKARELKPGQSAEYLLIMGVCDDPADISRAFRRFNSSARFQAALESTRQYWQRYLSGVRFDFGDRDLNNWLLWVQLQPTLRKLFGCSFLPHFDYGKGGRGWRDLWQDALTLLLTEPDKAKQIIVNSFKGVRLDGSNATIITRDAFLADRNRISRVWMDHGVWPYLTTRLYLDRSGDVELLLKKVPYFRDHQLHRAAKVDVAFSQKDFLQRDARGRVCEGTLLEHLLVQNLVQFFNVGRHNNTRLENADWNDGMDMAASQGESVAFTAMYGHNLKDLCRFLRLLSAGHTTVKVYKELLLLLDTLARPVNYSDPAAKQSRLKKYFLSSETPSGEYADIAIDKLIADLEAKAAFICAHVRRQEWLPEGFFNGYYDDNGRRPEGTRAGHTTMFLTSQVFALMSGAAGPEQVAATWRSIQKHLRDKRHGGYHLNTDMRQPQLSLGRAFGFAYGDKENGAFFSHMNVMLANALYKRGFVQEGFTVIDSIYRMACAPAAGIPPVLPEYFNAQGRGLYLYLTGSASWFIYTMVEQMLGITFCEGRIMLAPKLVAQQFRGSSIRLRLHAGGRPLDVTYQLRDKRARVCRISSVLVDGRRIHPETQGYVLPESAKAVRVIF